jgi:hypothetical protein
MEMVRLANIVPGIFRKALQDVEIKGIYTSGMPCRRTWQCFVCLQQVNVIFHKLRGTELCSVFLRCWFRLYDSGRMGHHGVPTGSALKP